MKIALLGKGKTGLHFKLLAESRNNISVTVFDRNYPPDAKRLAGHDVVVSFFPGAAFAQYIPQLIASGLPIVTGSTGFDWPGGRDSFSKALAEKGLTWIHGNNFSPGMTLVRGMIGILRNAGSLFDEYQFDLHEVHHTAKLDAPSGTALAWKEWTGEPVTITSERRGDVTGIHTLTLDTPFENISITHEALDRSLFASGAMRAVELVVKVEVEVEVEVETETETMAKTKTKTMAKTKTKTKVDVDDKSYPATGIGPGLHDFQAIVMQWLAVESGLGDFHAIGGHSRVAQRDGIDIHGNSETSPGNTTEPAINMGPQTGNGVVKHSKER